MVGNGVFVYLQFNLNETWFRGGLWLRKNEFDNFPPKVTCKSKMAVNKMAENGGFAYLSFRHLEYACKFWETDAKFVILEPKNTGKPIFKQNHR